MHRIYYNRYRIAFNSIFGTRLLDHHYETIEIQLINCQQLRIYVSYYVMMQINLDFRYTDLRHVRCGWRREGAWMRMCMCASNCAWMYPLVTTEFNLMYDSIHIGIIIELLRHGSAHSMVKCCHHHRDIMYLSMWRDGGRHRHHVDDPFHFIRVCDSYCILAHSLVHPLPIYVCQPHVL